MRRMIDPTKVGGLPSTIEFDKDGNRKVKKNLGVDGKLTLASLVSNTNPDGDITKELGGGGGGGSSRHHYTIIVGNTKFHYEVYTTKDYGYEPRKMNDVWDFKNNNNYQELRAQGYYTASGTWKDLNSGHVFTVNWMKIRKDNKIEVYGYDITETSSTLTESSIFDLNETNYSIIQNY